MRYDISEMVLGNKMMSSLSLKSNKAIRLCNKQYIKDSGRKKRPLLLAKVRCNQMLDLLSDVYIYS